MEDKRHVDDGDRCLMFADAFEIARFLPPGTPVPGGARCALQEGSGGWGEGGRGDGVRDGYDFTESKERELLVEEIPEIRVPVAFPDIKWWIDEALFAEDCFVRGSTRGRGNEIPGAGIRGRQRRSSICPLMEINSLRLGGIPRITWPASSLERSSGSDILGREPRCLRGAIIPQRRVNSQEDLSIAVNFR